PTFSGDQHRAFREIAKRWFEPLKRVESLGHGASKFAFARCRKLGKESASCKLSIASPGRQLFLRREHCVMCDAMLSFRLAIQDVLLVMEISGVVFRGM